MPYFPLFINLKDKNILVVGGGLVATRKIEKLLPFEPSVTVIAPQLDEAILEFKRLKKIKVLQREFKLEDLKNKDLVVVAVNQITLQREIFEQCVQLNIPCNSVDDKNYCSFIFPALIVRDDFVIGVSTSGKAPAIASLIKQNLEKYIPHDIEGLLDKVHTMREQLPKGKERMKEVFEFAKDLLSKK